MIKNSLKNRTKIQENLHCVFATTTLINTSILYIFSTRMPWQDSEQLRPSSYFHYTFFSLLILKIPAKTYVEQNS